MTDPRRWLIYWDSGSLRVKGDELREGEFGPGVEAVEAGAPPGGPGISALFREYEKRGAEAAEAERGRLAARVAELERERDHERKNREHQVKMKHEAERYREKFRLRLQQATATLEWYANPNNHEFEEGSEKGKRARSTLAALAGEDEKPANPQREGDYL